jgi:hypothetical protein
MTQHSVHRSIVLQTAHRKLASKGRLLTSCSEGETRARNIADSKDAYKVVAFPFERGVRLLVDLEDNVCCLTARMLITLLCKGDLHNGSTQPE